MKKLILAFGMLGILALTACAGGSGDSDPTSGGSKFVPGSVITEYNKQSKIYFSDSTNGQAFPTYHASGKNDIPYVNITDFLATVGSNLSSTTPKVEGKKLTLSKEDNNKSYVKFDAEANTLELNNIDGMTSFAKTNNNIGPDLALDATIYLRESNKTKIIQEGSSKTINLNTYGINIYEQGGQFYAPFELLTNTLLSSANYSYTYNGMDYFQDVDKFTSPEYTSLCYSGENGFYYCSKLSSGLSDVMGNFMKKEPKSNEAYRFQSIADDTGSYSAVVLNNDGTGKLVRYNSATQSEEPVRVEYNYSDGKRLFKYKKEDNKLKLEAYDVSLSESSIGDSAEFKHNLIINLDKTRFGEKERSRELADYNYGLLCLTFDHFYGVKQSKFTSSFDEFCQAKNVKNDLKSTTIRTYSDALAKTLQKELNDAHTAISSLSVFEDPRGAYYIQYGENYKSARNDEISRGTSVLNSKRYEVIGSDPLRIEGDTAFIAFDKFTSFGLLSGMNQYTEEPSDYAAYNTYNGLGIVCSALNIIANRPEVKNVVLDVTANTGGLLNVVPFIAGIATADPTMYLRNMVSGQVTEYHYTTYLNGDPDLTTLANKYNFYVMTSKYSFSCATALPTMLKGTNVKIIGEQSGGGTCPVFKCNDACGSTFLMSGIYTINYKDGNEYKDNENGVPVDIAIAEADFYNYQKVVQIIKNNSLV